MKKRYIIIYPYKFVDTLYTIMGLDEFSDETEVLILDISIIFNKKFSASIAADQTLTKVTKVKTIRQLIFEIRDIKKQSTGKNTCINNMVPLNSLKALIINLIFYLNFKDTLLKVLTVINTGLPNLKKSDQSTALLKRILGLLSIKRIIVLIDVHVWARVPSPMSYLITHKLIAGRHYMAQELKKNPVKNIKIIKGHSFDYDKFLFYRNQTIDSTDRPTIVFLDEPGPLFSSDYALTGTKVHKTIDIWYPSLSLFFDHIEVVFKAKVIIAGHYKSAFSSPSDFFGGREVLYGQTRKLIQESTLVITEQSSAISFAVTYRKPIFFIYSDESKNDLALMHFINNISEILKQPVCNINSIDTIPESLPDISENEYVNFEDQFLTSDRNGPTNAELIEHEVLQ